MAALASLSTGVALVARILSAISYRLLWGLALLALRRLARSSDPAARARLAAAALG